MAYTIAGIDVHKRMLAVVVSELAADAEDAFARRTFGSTPAQLRRLAAWLSERQVDEVVMESTAQYWRPVWAALERHWTPRARARAGLASNWPAPRRRSFPRSAGIFDPESAALSSVIFGPPFSLSPFRDAGSQRLYILCGEPVLLQALPRSWTTAAVALIVRLARPRAIPRASPRLVGAICTPSRRHDGYSRGGRNQNPSFLSSWRNRARPPGRPQPRGSAGDRLAIRLPLGDHPVRRLRQMPRYRPDGLGMALAAGEPRVEPREMAPG